MMIEYNPRTIDSTIAKRKIIKAVEKTLAPLLKTALIPIQKDLAIF